MHEDEHHGALRQGYAAELARCMGQEQAGVENALDIDVI